MEEPVAEERLNPFNQTIERRNEERRARERRLIGNEIMERETPGDVTAPSTYRSGSL
jgi:hypothetical protein